LVHYPEGTTTKAIVIRIQSFFDVPVVIKIQKDDTIGLVKQLFQIELGVPIQEQCLFFANRHLRDNRTVSDYQIYDGAMIGFTIGCYQIQVQLYEAARVAIAQDALGISASLGNAPIIPAFDVHTVTTWNCRPERSCA